MLIILSYLYVLGYILGIYMFNIVRFFIFYIFYIIFGYYFLSSILKLKLIKNYDNINNNSSSNSSNELYICDKDDNNINIPEHFAVIMDGNRRYGLKKYSDPTKGHWDGAEKIGDFCDWCLENGFKILTLYAFSTENWNREKHEIDSIMNLFLLYSEKMLEEALNKNIKINFISTDTSKISKNIKCTIKNIEEKTINNNKFILNICFSYGSRDEIVQACKNISIDYKNGIINNIDNINENYFSSYLKTNGMTDPDLLLRTSGEYRLSNYLLWQLAYTEIFFINKTWPDITKQDFYNILKEYHGRNRRYGS